MALDPVNQQPDDEQNAQQPGQFQALQNYVQAPAQPAPQAQPQPAPNVNVQIARPQPVNAPAQQPVQPRTAPQQFGPQAQQLQQPVQSPRQRTVAPTAYSRLQDYLQSSQSQAGQLGNVLQGNVMDQATAGRQALGQAAQSFSQKVEAAGLTRNADATSQLITKAANLKAGESLTPEELKQLTDISATQKGFQGLAPADLNAIAEHANAQASFDEAKTRAGLTASNSGTQSLLGDVYGQNNQYTTGQSMLDSILTGSSKVPATQLAGLRDQLVTQDVLGKEDQAAKDAATAKKASEWDEITQAANDVTSGIGMQQGQGALGTLEQTIRDRITTQNQRTDDINKLIDQVYQEGNIGHFGSTSAQQKLIAALGLSQNDINQIKRTGGVSTDIFQKLKQLNEETGTSKDDYAKLQALYNIADAFGRTSNKIGATGDADMGTLIDQKGGIDQQKVYAAQNQNAQQMNADKAQRVSNALDNTNIKDYRFGANTSVRNAAIDIYDRMRTGSFRDDIDNPEADKVISSMTSAATAIAQQYVNRGLYNSVGEFMARYNPTDADVIGDMNATIPTDSKGPFNSTMAALIANSPIFIRNGTGMFGLGKPRNMAELKKLDPNLFNRIYQSALKMAQIKKLSEDFGFFNQFRHMQ